MKHAIYTTLETIRVELLTCLEADSFPGDSDNDGTPDDIAVPDIVSLGNIAICSGNSIDFKGILMTLLKIDEENAAKQYPFFKKNGSIVTYKHPPINLNLYTIFSAIYPDDDGLNSGYGDGLKQISNVIQFFNDTRYFHLEDDEAKMKVSVKLISPSFDELNKIWSVLGGKLYPFALYKIHVVNIDSIKEVGKGKIIETIILDKK